MRYHLLARGGDDRLPQGEAAEELAALIHMTRFMADLVPRLVEDPGPLKAQLDRLEAELSRELSLAQLHPNGAGS